MLFATSICSIADNKRNDEIVATSNKVEMNIKKFEMDINRRRLACVLGMTVDQMETSDIVISEFQNDMAFAASMENEASSNKVVANAVKKNLRCMHYILDEKQYKKYAMLLNLTLMNKGFEMAEITK